MASITHLAKRFVMSLWPGGPTAAQERWVASVLSEAELGLWRRMSNPDRRHAVGVARRVEGALGAEATPPVLAAALLHDVGKVESGLGTFARVAATVAGRTGVARHAARVDSYLRHDQLGAELLAMADSDPLTVAWAREHHLAASRWTLPSHIAGVLKACDDD